MIFNKNIKMYNLYVFNYSIDPKYTPIFKNNNC